MQRGAHEPPLFLSAGIEYTLPLRLDTEKGVTLTLPLMEIMVGHGYAKEASQQWQRNNHNCIQMTQQSLEDANAVGASPVGRKSKIC